VGNKTNRLGILGIQNKDFRPMDNFTKIVNPAKMKLGAYNRPIFCKIAYQDGKLSISGVVGPKSNGNAYGGCGQIIMDFREYDHRGWTTLDALTLCDGWDRDMIKRFFDIWDRWHLNDMRAGSPSQEKYLRDHPVVAIYPESHYDKVSKVLAKAKLNPDENGYSYGSKWLREEVPDDILAFLAGLPDSKVKPAWC
jgi:hypothetical protein